MVVAWRRKRIESGYTILRSQKVTLAAAFRPRGTSAAAHEIGQLASTTTGSGYTRTHSYDAWGRPSSTTLTIDGTAYTATTAYTGDGRADTVTYPSGFAAKYVYTSTGYLAQVKDNATAAVLWTANARDAELRLTQATLGNGVVVDQAYDANTGLVQQIAAGPAQGVANFSYAFDTIGNLASRADTFQGTTEQFCYDALNRLTDSAFVSGGSTCTTGTGRKTVSYSAIGNILSKTGTGSYAYPASGGGAGSRPHAVSSVTGTVNGAVNPAYTYDLNGNMTAGAGRTVAYTAFNMAATITQGANSYAFSYDSEHQRIKQTAPGLTTLYLNAQGAMSEKLVGGSSTTWRDYLYTDGKLAAQRDRVVSTGTVTWSWFVTDHLGSAAVVTSASGAVTERLSYDAWGKRRNANGSDAACGTITSTATRGFTGHEMLGGLCLVNMNARIYDPDLGRFMAADTHVTDPLNLQDWNAYTYVNNNPLSFTDPTGHDIGSYGGSDFSYSPTETSSQILAATRSDPASTPSDVGQFVSHGENLNNSSSSPTAGGNASGSTNVMGAPGPLQNAFASPSSSIDQQTASTGSNETVVVLGSRGHASDTGMQTCLGSCGSNQIASLDPTPLPSGVTAIPTFVQLTANNGDTTKGHDKGKRKSTRGKHEEGDARRKQDRGKEKGDDRRSGPRKRPDGYKGPWPRPKENEGQPEPEPTTGPCVVAGPGGCSDMIYVPIMPLAPGTVVPSPIPSIPMMPTMPIPIPVP